MPRMSLSLDVKQRALEIGFDLAGIAPLSAWKDLEFSRAWIERGFGGEMRYLSNPQRHDPRRLLPSAQSMVCVGLVYNAPLPYSTAVEASGAGSQETKGARVSNFDFRVSATEDDGQPTADHGPRAWISRYAWGRDYHALTRAKLEKLRCALEALAPGAETRAYVDTGPIVERAFARLSGIGWMGKNTCLINERRGSWFFLGVVLTSLALEPDLAAADRCGSCAACLEACPTGALVEPYVMDASRCIAYLNIELKGFIPEKFRPAMGPNVFGCDICQDVCPWNSGSQKAAVRTQHGTVQTRAAATTTLPEFQPMEVVLKAVPGTSTQRATDHRQQTPGRVSKFDFRFSLFNPPLELLATLSEEDFRQVFRHSPIKRVKYRGWLRNLCVAMGNSRDTRFVPKLHELSRYPDPLVREHAAWALGELMKTPPTREFPR
jgi:epoxyqueuosine reductase